MYCKTTHFNTAWLMLATSLLMTEFAVAQRGQTTIPQKPDAHAIALKKPAGKITTADNFILATHILDELEIIQDEMGKPKNQLPEIDVQNATPHQVFFQSLTLFRKAGELCYEITRVRSPDIEIPTENIHSEDIWRTLNFTLAKLDLVKNRLGIKQHSQLHARDEGKHPNDVFRVIVQANRHLNLLLTRKFSPSDVFQEVTLAIHYTARLLAQFPDATRIPDAPAYQRRMHPKQVFSRLLACNGYLRQISKMSGINALTLRVDENNLELITPSDVYDIASVIISDLAFLHKQIPDIEPPAKAYYSGRKLPSDVFQRAGILEAQLTVLLKHVKASPDWLN